MTNQIVVFVRFLLTGIALLLAFLGYAIWRTASSLFRKQALFNSMKDAVLILDNKDKLLDFNPAAQRLLPALNKRKIGRDAASTLASHPELAKAVSSGADGAEIAIGKSTPVSYNLRIWPLFAGRSGPASRPSGQAGRAVILTDITAQVRLREELRRRSETDPLTGIANRRRFHQALEIECMRFTRGHAPLSVLMIDLDFFKEINDRYGHPAGDEVLLGVAQLLLASTRKTDVLARYGGEEFAVLLPETQCDGACIIAERIRQAICEHPIAVGNETISVSVSVGVASHANDDEVQPEILLKKADLALYRAKAAGRNRIEAI